jgi:class 3 adenylate cyclase
MFFARQQVRLASMSETDWSELGVSELLPTGTVTLLLADVEGSTRLWDADPVAMAEAVERLNRIVPELVTGHRGVRPVEQGEGDSFVAAFARATDSVACALALQRAPLAPIRLRIGVHTGEVILRDDGNYAGPTINRTPRLRDLAHGGQTVLSAVVCDLVEEALPAGAWLTDLGTHQLRDLPRPDHVTQLCHPDLRNDFPPLRSPNKVGTHGLPTHLTTFVGRVAALSEVRDLLRGSRLVTVTGAGDRARPGWRFGWPARWRRSFPTACGTSISRPSPIPTSCQPRSPRQWVCPRIRATRPRNAWPDSSGRAACSS